MEKFFTRPSEKLTEIQLNGLAVGQINALGVQAGFDLPLDASPSVAGQTKGRHQGLPSPNL